MTLAISRSSGFQLFFRCHLGADHSTDVDVDERLFLEYAALHNIDVLHFNICGYAVATVFDTAVYSYEFTRIHLRKPVPRF